MLTDTPQPFFKHHFHNAFFLSCLTLLLCCLKTNSYNVTASQFERGSAEGNETQITTRRCCAGALSPTAAEALTCGQVSILKTIKAGEATVQRGIEKIVFGSW